MKRLIFSALAALLWVAATPGAARADDTLKRVQQSLRDQGFYYGAINGAPGDEMTQAIRRYQIRNGLQVTGQLTEETRASILRNSGGSGSGGANAGGGNANGGAGGGTTTVTPSGTVRPRDTPSVAATPRPLPAATPTRAPAPTLRGEERPTAPSVRADEEDANGGFHRGAGAANPPGYRSGPSQADDEDGPVRPGPGRDLRGVPPNGIAPSATLSGLFADTPYEFAPPPVQTDTLRRAQIRLLRQGFYDRDPDGRPNALTTEALTNFQGVNHLRRTGRLDTATLGAMRLLPERGRGGPNGAFGDEAPRRGPGPNAVYEGRVVQ